MGECASESREGVEALLEEGGQKEEIQGGSFHNYGTIYRTVIIYHCIRSNALTSATLAKSKAVSSSLLCKVVSAPAATSNAVWPLSPSPAATCRGVLPSNVVASTSQFA